MQNDFEISPAELQAKLIAKMPLILIDVREKEEYDICCLKEAQLISIRDLPSRAGELDAGAEMVLYCHHGMRSLQAALWLRKNGFPNVKSLSGGIEAWAEEIDPSMERY